MPETIAVKPSTRQRSMKALTCTVPEPSGLPSSAFRVSCRVCRAPDASITDHSKATATKRTMPTAMENISETFITDHGSSRATRSLAFRAGRTVPPAVRTRPVRGLVGTAPAAGFAAAGVAVAVAVASASAVAVTVAVASATGSFTTGFTAVGASSCLTSVCRRPSGSPPDGVVGTETVSRSSLIGCLSLGTHVLPNSSAVVIGRHL